MEDNGNRTPNLKVVYLKSPFVCKLDVVLDGLMVSFDEESSQTLYHRLTSPAPSVLNATQV